MIQRKELAASAVIPQQDQFNHKQSISQLLIKSISIQYMPNVGLITLLNLYPIKIGVSQLPLLKSLKSSLGLILWGCASKLARDYQADSNIICNDQRKSTNNICVQTPKGLVQSQLRLLIVVNKSMINPIYAQLGIDHTLTLNQYPINFEASQIMFELKLVKKFKSLSSA